MGEIESATAAQESRRISPELVRQTLQLMEGFSYSAENVWGKGTIYNPDDGRTYKSKMKLTGPNRLEVRGFVIIPLFGGTSIWTR